MQQDGAKSPDYGNLLALWRQWNEITSRAWTTAIYSGKESIQERMKTSTQAQFDFQSAWKLWLDTTMNIWHQAAHMGGDPLGLIAGWIKVMENMQEQMGTNGSAALDPFILFREWYNATSEQWSKVVEEAISSGQLLQFTGPFLESSSSLIGAFRHASEEYFKTLRLSTSSDIANLAELVVNLEAKIDDLEDTLDRVEEQATQTHTALETTTIEHATDEAKVTSLEQHLNQVEAKLDRMLALLEKADAGMEESATTTSAYASKKHKTTKQDE
jgi:polyhydroxyalkanoic acid synthase PhaR subunit